MTKEELQERIFEILVRFDTNPNYYLKEDYFTLIRHYGDALLQVFGDLLNVEIVSSWEEVISTLQLPSGPLIKSTIEALLTNKLDKLIAGTNIQIAEDGKTISATDTIYDDTEVRGLITANTNAITAEASTRSDADDDLQDQITDLKSRGKFLALWNSATGMPINFPYASGYEYKVGDYVIVSQIATGVCTHAVTLIGQSTEGLYEGTLTYNVTFSFTNQVSTAYTTLAQVSAAIGALGSEVRVPASGSVTLEDSTIVNIVKVIAWTDSTLGLLQADEQKACITNQAPTTLTDVVTGTIGTTNYKPSGATYTGTASSVAETSGVAIGSYYYYSGSEWLLLDSGKEDVNNKVSTLDSSAINYPSCKAVTDKLDELILLVYAGL